MKSPVRLDRSTKRKQFLDAHPEIEAFDIVLTDANGVGRGKIIRRHELMGLYEGGRHLPISILGLDITGEDVHETGLIWDSGDGDLRGWPIPGTLKPLHGTSPARGQVLMSMYQLDGAPMTSDPRHALARQVEAAGAQGPASGRRVRARILPARQRARRRGPRPAGERGARRPQRAARPRSIRSTICTAWSRCFPTSTRPPKLQGIPAETVISEYAPGQYELTLHYRKDVMQAADDLVMLKRLVRAQARRHGVTACFMAKPIEKYAGSGMHLHVSLQDDAGATSLPRQATERGRPTSCTRSADLPRPWRNRCWSLRRTPIPGGASSRNPMRRWRRPGASTTARWRCACRQAMRRTGASSIARRASTPILIWSPRPCWPASPRASTKSSIPARKPPATAMRPALRRTAAMPADWRTAIEAAKASAFLKDALGEDLHRTFTAIKQAEYLRVARPSANSTITSICTRCDRLPTSKIFRVYVKCYSAVANRTYHEQMAVLSTREKLAILSDAAKYDASCASSGAAKRNSLKSGGIGSTEGMGICHSYAPDGRCISLLKILLTNFCIYDCSYCINRSSSNVRRARFTIDEVVRLTIDFYKRNYIEGLFLSSGVIRSPDETMGEMVEVARRLRDEEKFGGYIHLKTIPESLGRTAGSGGPICRPAVDQCRVADRRGRQETGARKEAGNHPAFDGEAAREDRGKGRTDAADEKARALRAGRSIDADDHRRRRHGRCRHPCRPARGSTAAIICGASIIRRSARSRMRRPRCR